MFKLIVITGQTVTTSTFDGYHAETCVDQLFAKITASTMHDFVIIMHDDDVRNVWSKGQVKNGPWVPKPPFQPNPINRVNSVKGSLIDELD